MFVGGPAGETTDFGVDHKFSPLEHMLLTAAVCTEMPAPPTGRALLLGRGGVGHGFRCAGGVPSSVRPLYRRSRPPLAAYSLPRGRGGRGQAAIIALGARPLPERQVLDPRNPRHLPPAPIPPPPCSPPPLGRAEERRPWGPRNSLPPSGGGRTRRTPRALLFPSHSGHSSDRWSSDPGGGCPARLTQARDTNLRGVAAHAARWGGVGRTTGIGFLHSPSLQRAPSNPPALGLGGRRGHTRRPRELTSRGRGSRRRGNSVHWTVGRQKTPCVDRVTPILATQRGQRISTSEPRDTPLGKSKENVA